MGKKLQFTNGKLVDAAACSHDWTAYVAVDATARRVRVCDKCDSVERV